MSRSRQRQTWVSSRRHGGKSIYETVPGIPKRAFRLLAGEAVLDYMRAWNCLRACLQINPKDRPKLATEDATFDKPYLQLDQQNNWTQVMSQSLKPRRPVSRRQRQPLSCVPDAFPMMAESPQLSSFVHDGESGAISAQAFVHVDKRVPFGSFRSFRAALTSMRHKKQDPVIELEGGRRYQAYATSIRMEGADDDIFTKHFMDPFALWAKWALRVQEASWSHAVFQRQQLYILRARVPPVLRARRCMTHNGGTAPRCSGLPGLSPAPRARRAPLVHSGPRPAARSCLQRPYRSTGRRERD